MDKDRAPGHHRGRARTIEIETNLEVGREDGRGGDERQREDCSNSKTKIHDSILTFVDCKLCQLLQVDDALPCKHADQKGMTF